MKFRLNPALQSDRVQIGDDFYQAGQTYSTNKPAFKELAEVTMPVQERQRVEVEGQSPTYVTVTVAHPVFVEVDE
jgi:hypothetical protein